jgi:hypothetical protein
LSDPVRVHGLCFDWTGSRGVWRGSRWRSSRSCARRWVICALETFAWSSVVNRVVDCLDL